jgi:hypothetical protein
MSVFLLVALVLGLVLVGLLVVREVRLSRRAKDDRVATLEGGGSHLTTRKGG